MPNTRESLLSKIDELCPGGADGLREMRATKRMKIMAIAEGCGCPRNTVVGWLSALGLTRKHRSPSMPTDEQVELLREFSAKGARIEEIAKHPKIAASKNLVRRWVSEAELPTPRQALQAKCKALRNSELEKVVTMHTDGHSIEEISEHVTVSSTTVRRWLRAEGIDTTAKLVPTERQARAIQQAYEDGLSFPEIARTTRSNVAVVAYYFRETGQSQPSQKPITKPKEPVAKPEPKVRVKVSKSPEPIAKLPPGHKSIAQRLREGTITSGDYQGYRLIALESVPTERRMCLEDILSLEIPPDYQRGEKPC
jgi:transposase